MLKWAKDISSIAQGIAALVFLYTVFYPHTTATDQGTTASAMTWTPTMWSGLALGIAVLSGVAVNILAAHKQAERYGLRILSAKWYCTVKGTKKDVTKSIQGKVIGDSLRIQAHDSVLGDICQIHGGAGHPKSLEVEMAYRYHLTANHSEWINVLSPKDQALALEEEQRKCAHLNTENASARQSIDRLVTQNEECMQAGAYRLMELGRVQEELKNEIAQRGKLSDEQRIQIMQAATFLHLAKEAERMNKFLEEVWHLYNDDKQHVEGPLLNPLRASAIPDDIKEWRHKELWRFRTLYRAHLQAVKDTDPDLRTSVVDFGFPSDGPSYLEVRENLSNHAGFLRERASRLLSPFVAAA